MRVLLDSCRIVVRLAFSFVARTSDVCDEGGIHGRVCFVFYFDGTCLCGRFRVEAPRSVFSRPCSSIKRRPSCLAHLTLIFAGRFPPTQPSNPRLRRAPFRPRSRADLALVRVSIFFSRLRYKAFNIQYPRTTVRAPTNERAQCGPTHATRQNSIYSLALRPRLPFGPNAIRTLLCPHIVLMSIGCKGGAENADTKTRKSLVAVMQTDARPRRRQTVVADIVGGRRDPGGCSRGGGRDGTQRRGTIASAWRWSRRQ